MLLRLSKKPRIFFSANGVSGSWIFYNGITDSKACDAVVCICNPESGIYSNPRACFEPAFVSESPFF